MDAFESAVQAHLARMRGNTSANLSIGHEESGADVMETPPGPVKLGVAYNVFDGEELLEASIASVRPLAQYVCVVYQVGAFMLGMHGRCLLGY